eukprot:Gb_25026 [translate_table: standard]
MVRSQFIIEASSIFIVHGRMRDEKRATEYKRGMGPVAIICHGGYLKICKEVKEICLSLSEDYFIDKRKKLASVKGSTHIVGSELKCAVDHILNAEKKGEINEDNVLYIVENINVADSTMAANNMSLGLSIGLPMAIQGATA